MSKRHTSLNIDEDTLIAAKEKGYNLSEIAEEALRNKLGKKTIEIDVSDKCCEFCDSPPMRTATADNLKGLTWLWPDEMWICPKCLKAKSLKEVYG